MTRTSDGVPSAQSVLLLADHEGEQSSHGRSGFPDVSNILVPAASALFCRRVQHRSAYHGGVSMS